MLVRVCVLISISILTFAPAAWSQQVPGSLLKEAAAHIANWR
jgi:hypothetical protein